MEALRIGADAFASDLNPVAVMLNRVLVQFIPKYGERLARAIARWMWTLDDETTQGSCGGGSCR